MRSRLNRGFTLIELLVVIAILGILSAGVLIAINPAQKLKQGRDAKRESDMAQIATAIQSYTISHFGAKPINRTPGSAYCSNHSDFLQELIDTQELTVMPQPPNSTYNYCYYDYGGATGAILATQLESLDPTIIPPAGTCRPFTNNWCSSTNPNNYYCLCL